MYTWSRLRHFNKEKKIREKKLNRYKANLVRTLPPSPVFLLEIPIFYIPDHELLLSKAVLCDWNKLFLSKNWHLRKITGEWMNLVPLFFGYYEHGDIILNYYISILWAWSYSKLYLHQYLPLFFVVMKTNVNYQVVASFVLQDETTAAIIEALSVIKTWNPIWNPKSFVVDKCDKDIKWIGNIFL